MPDAAWRALSLGGSEDWSREPRAVKRSSGRAFKAGQLAGSCGTA